MNGFFLYRISQEHEPGKQLLVHSLGIHEKMMPELLHYPDGRHHLLMFFHSPAKVNAGLPDECLSDKHFIIWEPGVPRNYGNSDSPWEHSWLVVEGNALKHAIKMHEIPLNTPIHANAEDVFDNYLTLLYNELTSHMRQDEYPLEHILDLLFYELSRLIKTEGHTIPDNIQNAVKFMWQNIDQPLSVEQIAREASLSVSRFIPIFKKCYGEPPMHYLYRKRMDLAAQLLIYQSYSCKQIAERTGFRDQLNFSRRFRQFWGYSPRDYRNRNTACPESNSRKS